MAKPIRVLLYYKYLPIENAEQFAADHLAFCKSIGLKGRILVADEGINGTVSGDYETTQKYMDYVHSLPGMEDLPDGRVPDQCTGRGRRRRRAHSFSHQPPEGSDA